MSNEFNRTARMQEGIALGKSNFEENRKQERIKQKHKENAIKDEQKKEERRQLAEKMHLENRLSANVDEIMTIIRVCEAIASKKRREEKNKQEKIKQTREKYAIKVEQRNEERRWLAEEIKEGNHLSASVDEIMTIITNCEILESKKRREEKNKRIEKATKKKKVAKKIVAGALLAVLAAGGACASGLPSYLDGKRQIAEQFYSATTSYGVHDSSEGFKILHNGKISTTTMNFSK